MKAECRMRIADCGLRNGRQTALGGRQPVVYSALRTPHSALFRRRMAAGLTLIEILIALFIFMVGSLGVLSVFPVAINTAGRVIGETRGNILAQSVVAQLTADCRVNFELPTTGSALAGTTPVPTNTQLLRQPVTSYPNNPTPGISKNQYFVTLLDGPGRGQSRFITSDPGAWGSTITVAPPWTPVTVTDNINAPIQWTAPGSLATPTASAPYFPNEHYSITRMGLPERPLVAGVAGDPILQGAAGSSGSPPPATPYYVSPQPAPYSYGTYGLNRDLVVRSFIAAAGSSFAMPDGLLSGFAPNGFFAGIANRQSSPATAAPFIWDSGTATNTSASETGDIWDSTKTGASAWPLHQFIGYQVRLVSNSGAGQVRTVTDNDAQHLYVSPPWNFPQPPQSFTAPGYEIGWANTDPATGSARDFTWCMRLRLASDSSTWNPGAGTDINHIFRGTNPASWPISDLTGKYVYLTGGTGAGQARAIQRNDANSIYVTPAFTTAPDTTTTTYELMESHGYVLITSGRATNRLFPIVWDQSDATKVEGHLIVCAGTDFQSLTAITAAARPPASPTQWNLQDATTFTVIGNQSPRLDADPMSLGYAPFTPMLLNATPNGYPIIPFPWYDSGPLYLPSPPNAASTPYYHWPYPAPPPPQPANRSWPPPWFNTLNIVGHPNRMAPDQYISNDTIANTSDYSYGVVFSDSGTDPSLPVRVDVFVWRNFDISKDFVENQKPVGHMAGYIKRP